jgi:hemolysin-activating ACP:hemolysin acyltransferase
MVMTDLEYITQTYYEKETWHETKLPKDIGRTYFTKGLENKNFVVLREEGLPIGYISVWFLDNEQTSRVISGQAFHAVDENITDGEIVFVANAYVEKEHRHNKKIMQLNQAMKDAHKTHDYVGIIFQDGFNKGKFSFYKKGEI